MKKFLDKNAPNNILDYLDVNKGLDSSFSDWYNSDIRISKNPVYAGVYAIIVAKPKVEFWIHQKISDVSYSIGKFVKKVLK